MEYFFFSRWTAISCAVCPYVSCSCVFLFFFVCEISPSRYERRGDFSIKSRSDWDGRIRWMKLDILCTTLTAVRLMISTVASQYSLHFFEMISRFRTNRCRSVLNFIRLEYSLQTINSFELRSVV